MNIIVTGSLGNIGKPLAEILIRQGHDVTVITSDANKAFAIQALGARPAVGSLTDVAFLRTTFSGADAVYAMIPLSFAEPDLEAYTRRIAENYVQAILSAGVRRVVALSGWAADLVGEGDAERIFGELPGVSLSILRPASFYTNFYQSMDLIRGAGLMGTLLTLRYVGVGALLRGRTGLLMGNYGGDDRVVFVSPLDIADAAAEELLTGTAPPAPSIRYVGSEEMTCNEAARIIGTAIGKPWLKWILLTDKQMLQGLKMAKVPEKLALTLVGMQAAMHSGKTLENFHKSNPRMGKVKLADFAREFATAYRQKYR